MATRRFEVHSVRDGYLGSHDTLSKACDHLDDVVTLDDPMFIQEVYTDENGKERIERVEV